MTAKLDIIGSLLAVAVLAGGCSATRPRPPDASPYRWPLLAGPNYDVQVVVKRINTSSHEARVTTRADGVAAARGRRASERLEFIGPSGAGIAHLDKLPRTVADGQFEGKFLVELPDDLPSGRYRIRVTFYADSIALLTRTNELIVERK